MVSKGLVIPPPAALPHLPPRVKQVVYEPSPLIKKLLDEVLKVHQFLIGNNLFHGDIGFSNVMVIGETVKFIDMDSIKPIESQEGYLEVAKQNIAQSGIYQLRGFRPFPQEEEPTLSLPILSGETEEGGRRKTRRKTRRRKQKRRRTKARK
jgi:hypothetical protein